jgi:hypothetical protein
MIKKILLGLLVVFIVLQAFRPAKNNTGDKSKDISLSYPVSDSVTALFNKACNDCHSNNTEYPWYAEVQPLGWWLNDHVIDGKKHFNLNEFSSYRIAKQYHKLEECIEQVKEGEMPLESYTVIHKEARLSEAERETLVAWFESIRDSMKLKYPADSLVIKRKK